MTSAARLPSLGVRQAPAREKSWVEVNGVRQGLFIRGHDGAGEPADKPVLRFVHGGLCMPEYFLYGTHPTGL